MEELEKEVKPIRIAKERYGPLVRKAITRPWPVIGMGVDDGVHMFHRYKELGPGSAWYIVKTTGMSAVLLPFDTAGAVDFAALAANVERTVAAGVSAAGA